MLPLNTGDCLIEVTAWGDLTVHCLIIFFKFQMESKIISNLTSMGGHSTSAGPTQTSMPVSNIYHQMYIVGFV
jgi:hypothetical protein